MKRSWIGFVLLLVLLAGGIAATWGMAKCHEPIARDLETPRKRRFRETWRREKC